VKKMSYKECITYLRCRKCKDITKHYLFGVTDNCEDQVFECECGRRSVWSYNRKAKGSPV